MQLYNELCSRQKKKQKARTFFINATGLVEIFFVVLIFLRQYTDNNEIENVNNID